MVETTQNSVSKEQIFEAIKNKSNEIREDVGTLGVSATGLRNQAKSILNDLQLIEGWYQQYIERLKAYYEKQVADAKEELDGLEKRVAELEKKL